MANQISYSKIETALSSLSFEKKQIDNDHFAYLNRAHNVLFTLPISPPDQPVLPSHLIIIRKMVVEKGVTDEENWNTLLYSNDVKAQKQEPIYSNLEGDSLDLQHLHLVESRKRELSLAIDTYHLLLRALGTETCRAPSMFSLNYLGPSKTLEKYRLTLWCEWPEGPHPCNEKPGSGGSGEFEFERSREWVIKAKPWIEWSTRILKVVQPGVATGLRDTLDSTLLDELKTPLDLMDFASRALPTGEMDAKRGVSPELGGSLRPEGDALRLFHDLLEELSKETGRKWGDLRCVPTKAGEFLWLCPQHAAIYDPGLPVIE